MDAEEKEEEEVLVLVLVEGVAVLGSPPSRNDVRLWNRPCCG